VGISSINITITGPKEEKGMFVLPGIACGIDLVSQIKERADDAPKAAKQASAAQAPVRHDEEMALLVRELRALNLNLAGLLAALKAPLKK